MDIATFTLDTNCIIALENGEPNSSALKKLIGAHAAGTANLACVAISASEKQKGGLQLTNFQDFQARLDGIGLGKIGILKPKGYWDITFWDWCLLADENDKSEFEIHNILFPAQQFEAPAANLANAALLRTWRNRKCDVLALWTHSNEKRRYFVTSDKNFLNKMLALRAVGYGSILSPEDAAKLI